MRLLESFKQNTYVWAITDFIWQLYAKVVRYRIQEIGSFFDWKGRGQNFRFLSPPFTFRCYKPCGNLNILCSGYKNNGASYFNVVKICIDRDTFKLWKVLMSSYRFSESSRKFSLLIIPTNTVKGCFVATFALCFSSSQNSY